MSDAERASGLAQLGAAGTTYTYDQPNAGLLERFPSPFGDVVVNPNQVDPEIAITAPEFTSLCPKTGQPDFATILVRYTPGDWCVESKSFKLYLGSFRMHGEFHESCVNRICNDLVELLNPVSIEVVGEFTPRGGISFWPRAVWSRDEGESDSDRALAKIEARCGGDSH